MKARIAAAATLVALMVGLAGCSAISAGTITAKVHEPRRTYVCSVKPIIICTDDEDWRFDLADDDATGWVYVDRDTFDAYEVGDHYGEVTQ